MAENGRSPRSLAMTLLCKPDECTLLIIDPRCA